MSIFSNDCHPYLCCEPQKRKAMFGKNSEKKKQVRLELKKSTIAALNANETKHVFGGGDPVPGLDPETWTCVCNIANYNPVGRK
jgi:hypothetical protein